MKLDIGVDYKDRFEVEVINPNTGLPVETEKGVFKVMLHSPKGKFLRTRFEQMADNLAIRNAKLGRKITPYAETVGLTNQRLAEAHISWENVPVEGDDPPCTKETVKALLEETDDKGVLVNDWYRDFIAEQLGEVKNSLAEASKPSAKPSSGSSKDK